MVRTAERLLAVRHIRRWRHDSDGTNLKRLDKTERLNPTWSPDGCPSVFAGFVFFAGLRRSGVPRLVPVPALNAFGRHGADVSGQVTTRASRGQRRVLGGLQEVLGVLRIARDVHDLILADIFRTGGNPGLFL